MSNGTERRLTREEKEFATHLDTSATNARHARRALLIPDDVQGITTVDLGSGASNLIADLLRGGADANGVDQMYAMEYLTMEEKIWQSFNKVLRQIPPQYVERMRITTNETIRDFLQSFATSRNHYKAGWFSHLPFTDNFSDFTTSLNAHSDLAGNYPLFRKTLMEAIRITAPGKPVVIAPYHRSDGFHSQFATEHHRFSEELKRTTSHRVEIVGPDEIYKDSRLVITKWESKRDH